MSRSKVSEEERVEAAKACAEGRMSQHEAARRLGVNRTVVREWVSRYKEQGVLGFKEQEHNTIYSEEIKMKAVSVKDTTAENLLTVRAWCR